MAWEYEVEAGIEPSHTLDLLQLDSSRITVPVECGPGTAFAVMRAGDVSLQPSEGLYAVVTIMSGVFCEIQ